MNIKLFLALILLFYLPASAQVKVTKLSVVYEDFATETVEDVPCEYFKAAFAGSLKTIDITGADILKDLLPNFKPVKPRAIDVRAVIVICRNKLKEEWCMDRFGVFVNKTTGKYYTNKRLFDLLSDRCGQKGGGNFVIFTLPKKL